VAAAGGQLAPSGELLTKIFAWPLGCRALQTTWTPRASAATAERLSNREKVSPLGQAKGPSPQSTPPEPPVKSAEVKGVKVATRLGRPKLCPPSVDLTTHTASRVWP
jgi:hypothetical protein